MQIKSARDALKTALKRAIQKKNPAEAAVELICIDIIGVNINLIFINLKYFTTE